MRLIIAGSRTFDDYRLLCTICDRITTNSPHGTVEIISGGAKGADSLGERYAIEKGFGLRIFPADWERHGKSAGYIRNIEMAEYGDTLAAFWDGCSKGTEHMIRHAKEKGLTVHIIKF